MNVASCKGELWREGEESSLIDPSFLTRSSISALTLRLCFALLLLRSIISYFVRTVASLNCGLKGMGGEGARELGEKYSLAVLFWECRGRCGIYRNCKPSLGTAILTANS